MSATLTIQGLDAFREALRNLPAELTAEANSIVQGAATAAAAGARANYGRHRRTGDLENKVTVKPRAQGPLSASYQVKSGSRLAFIFEHGTQVRHYVTSGGRRHLTGKMPPFHAFVPPVLTARRAMNQSLIDLLRRHGLVVTGGV